MMLPKMDGKMVGIFFGGSDAKCFQGGAVVLHMGDGIEHDVHDDIAMLFLGRHIC